MSRNFLVVDPEESHEVLATSANTLNAQTTVVPRDGMGAKAEGATLQVSLPPLSYQMLRLRVWCGAPAIGKNEA